MPIDERMIDQAYSDCRATYGGVREDCFGLLYLEKEFGLSREQAAVQVAFGGNDYGIDGFQIDPQRRNLYLNDERLPDHAERFGRNLVCEADYTEWLAGLASTRARFLLSGIVERSPYAEMMEEERYDFLRTRAVYDKCMELAYKKWRWVQKRLK